ncbi:sensor histidine kinase [Kineococcus terrestris]|uniref:sensor histidine kinase n=1 Tax=Kineococcus terrestris TaxID=2044856 RepID=UPI0034DAE0A8
MGSRGGHALVVGVSVAGAAAGVALDPAASAPWDVVFGACLLAGLLTLLRLALRAGARALDERGRARRLAGTSAEEVARRAVVVERGRLAADIEAVVRSAVLRMTASAEVAQRDWDRDPRPALREVQAEGERAALELRRLLGLLRESEQADPAAVAGPAPATALPRGDVPLAAALVALALAERTLYGVQVAGGAAGAALTALAAGTVLARRARPSLGAAACGGVFTAGHLTGSPVSPGLWVLAVVGVLAWACAARQERLPEGLAGVVLLLAGTGASLAADDPSNAPVVVVALVGSAAGGLAVRGATRSGQRARRRAGERADQLARATEEAVRAQRLSVARDLHDLVSSAVGVVVVHSGAAEALREQDPAAARASLDVVRRTTAETLGELDELTAVIDRGALGSPAPPGAVEHGPGDVTALVERVRGAGLDVSLTVQPLGPGVGAALTTVVYRVVQESLTNVARHAPGSSVAVEVTTRPGEVLVDVVDDGPGRGAGARRGYGLVGLAERVERVGGRLETGPGPGGRGFRVRARLPAEVGA